MPLAGRYSDRTGKKALLRTKGQESTEDGLIRAKG